jgi:hypothetical protein
MKTNHIIILFLAFFLTLSFSIPSWALPLCVHGNPAQQEKPCHDQVPVKKNADCTMCVYCFSMPIYQTDLYRQTDAFSAKAVDGKVFTVTYFDIVFRHEKPPKFV